MPDATLKSCNLNPIKKLYLRNKVCKMSNVQELCGCCCKRDVCRYYPAYPRQPIKICRYYKRGKTTV